MAGYPEPGTDGVLSWLILIAGVVLCIGGCLIASLGSAFQIWSPYRYPDAVTSSLRCMDEVYG